jgi:Leucine-rich repeat (LRR) protein
MSHLVNLKQLSLANNMINEIPPEIKMLVNLEQLNLMRNKLREIPSEIGFLMKLKELLLGKNHIEKIPNQLEKNISVSKFYSPKLKKRYTL